MKAAKMTWCFLAGCLLIMTVPICAGDISGRIVITKRLTRKALPPPSYDLRGAAVIPAVLSSSMEAEYDRTIIMLEGVGLSSRQPETVTVNQMGTRFDPELVVIPAGSTVEFPNSDPIFHNVFSFSGTKSFDLGYYPKGKSKAVKFDRPGVVQVYCHIHSSMYAAVVVTNSEFYGKPASDGTFQWTNVPAGHYKMIAWHKVAGLSPRGTRCARAWHGNGYGSRTHR